MSESSLSLTLPQLRVEVGFFLGYGRDSTSWTDDKLGLIDQCIKSGLRQFYSPPKVGAKSHQWRFMRPVTTLTTVADTYEYQAPDAFGDIDGDMTFTAQASCKTLDRTSDERIREWRQVRSETGRPRYYATRAVVGSGIQGQRFQFILYPTPDAAYELIYRYKALPDMLSDEAPYPLGGQSHSETILASCLSAAEWRLNNTRGTEHANFMQRLATSIDIDNAAAPDTLGYNGDNSALRDYAFRSGDRHYDNLGVVVTINGSLP